MVVYSKAKRNGKQVRKNKRKNLIKNKTEKRNRKTSPPRARNKKPFLWET